MPVLAAKPTSNEKPTVRDIRRKTDGRTEHTPEIGLGKAALSHSSLDVRGQLERPVPPRRSCVSTHAARLPADSTLFAERAFARNFSRRKSTRFRA
jgi:hypothetical protein